MTVEINLYERMLPTSAGVEPATSWSPVGHSTEPPRPNIKSISNTFFNHMYDESGLGHSIRFRVL